MCWPPSNRWRKDARWENISPSTSHGEFAHLVYGKVPPCQGVSSSTIQGWKVRENSSAGKEIGLHANRWRSSNERLGICPIRILKCTLSLKSIILSTKFMIMLAVMLANYPQRNSQVSSWIAPFSNEVWHAFIVVLTASKIFTLRPTAPLASCKLAFIGQRLHFANTDKQ